MLQNTNPSKWINTKLKQPNYIATRIEGVFRLQMVQGKGVCPMQEILGLNPDDVKTICGQESERS